MIHVGDVVKYNGLMSSYQGMVGVVEDEMFLKSILTGANTRRLIIRFYVHEIQQHARDIFEEFEWKPR